MPSGREQPFRVMKHYLQTGCNIDSIPQYLLAILDHIPKVDTDAKLTGQ